MKINKFPTTEKEVIAFELKHKDNYKEPKKWDTIDDIINSKQLTIHSVSKSFLKILKTFINKRLVWFSIVAIWCAFWVFMIFKYVC
jgi:hypothetical protein